MLKFNVEEKEKYTVVEIKLDGIATPDMLREIVPPKVNPKKLVIISGRGPIWLYAYLLHHYHPVSAIAVYDPRLGAIVVQTHTPSFEVGDIIELEEEG